MKLSWSDQTACSCNLQEMFLPLFSAFNCLIIHSCDSTIVWFSDQVWGQDNWILGTFFVLFIDWYAVKVHEHPQNYKKKLQVDM